MDQPADLNGLTVEECHEEYAKLFERFLQLRESSEIDAQRIHDLKRSLNTATAAEAYLALELEQLTTSSCSGDHDAQAKLEHKLEELRDKYNVLLRENTQWQQDCEALEQENVKLRDSLQEATRNLGSASTVTISESEIQREQQLEQENLYLLEKLEEFQENTVRHTMILADREKNIEILREQVKCIEENLCVKREELEEVTQLLESTQEQLLEANSKLAMLTAAPGENDRKGNSLFAEVDDQRQAMKQMLAAQKSSYLHMKKIYNESEYEIRRLKRENLAMHTELQACSSIFCNADKTYQEKLNERIAQLLAQKENLEKKLVWTQDRLKEMASGKGMVWLDSMLNFCKQETAELKKQLHSVRIQKATLEEQFRNSQQEMARWRFDSLKSRCLLMDRENLLHENKIAFKPNSSIEFNFSQRQLETATPHIQTAVETEVVHIKPTTPKKECALKVSESQSPVKNLEHKTLEINANVKNIEEDKNSLENCLLSNEEKTCSETCPSSHECIISTENQENNDDQNFSKPNRVNVRPLQEISAKPNTIHVIDLSEVASPIALAAPVATKPLSILCKNKSQFSKETVKTVQFSDNEIKSPKATNSSNMNVNTKANGKQVRKKSNVVVRRVIVKSKHES